MVVASARWVLRVGRSEGNGYCPLKRRTLQVRLEYVAKNPDPIIIKEIVFDYKSRPK